MNQLQEPEVIETTLARRGLAEGPEDASGFTASDLLEILKQHRVLFLSVFLTVVAMGALYIFGSHKKYSSEMELMVQNARSEAVISAGRQEAPASTQEVSEEELGSEVALLQSEDVLNEVVDPGWSSVPSDKHTPADLERHEQGLNGLKNNLVVTPVKLSHVFTVQLTTRSPYDATKELNRLLMAFLAEKRRISHPSGASSMFAQQAETYKQQWKDAQDQLSNFQQQNQVVSVSDQEQLIQKEILGIDTELRESDVAIAEAQQKIHGDQAQLASVPSRRPTRETSIPASGSIDGMQSKLSELTLQRTELLAKYRPDDRLVKQVDDKITDIRAALADSRSLHSAETSTDINPTWQMADQDLSETTARLSGLLGRQKELHSQLSELQGRLSTVSQSTQEFNLLQQKVTELEANYQLYAQKRDESTMAEVMDEHQLLNVAVIQAPTFSPTPVRPRPVNDGLLTIVTALFLASLAVFLAHNSRSTVANERDLQGVSRYPTLASVPTMRGLRGNEESA